MHTVHLHRDGLASSPFGIPEQLWDDLSLGRVDFWWPPYGPPPYPYGSITQRLSLPDCLGIKPLPPRFLKLTVLHGRDGPREAKRLMGRRRWADTTPES